MYDLCLVKSFVLCLSSILQYIVKEKLPHLLEAFGAQVVPVGEYAPHSQVPF